MNFQLNIFVGLIGVFLGWLLTQLSNWYKERKSDNRIRKVLVFKLLELLSRVDIVNVKKHTDEIAKKVDSIILGKNESGKEKEFSRIGSMLIGEELYLKKYEIAFDKLLEQYSESVNELSKIDPIVAFELLQKVNNIKRIRSLSHSFESIFNPKDGDEYSTVFALKLREYITSKSDDAIYLDLDKYIKKQILRLSVAISPGMFFRSKRLIKKLHNTTAVNYVEQADISLKNYKDALNKIKREIEELGINKTKTS